MSKKSKPLNDCRSWEEFEDYATEHGIPYLYTNSGHAYHGNTKGKMPFSTHEKEPSKHLRGQVIRQIKALATVAISCLAFVALLWAF